MKIYFLFGFLLISNSSFSQLSLEEILSLVESEVEEDARPPTLCSDREMPPNAACFDYPPVVPIVEAIREALDDDVYVKFEYFENSNILATSYIYTEDVGLTADEIRGLIEPSILPNGNKLIDLVTIIEGAIPNSE